MTEESEKSKEDVNSINCHYFSDTSACEYLYQLFKDFQNLSYFPNTFHHVDRILRDEITKVRNTLSKSNTTNKEEIQLPEPQGPIISLSEKLYVPTREYPDFNFVGRILGPRGLTAKQLERETGCKIMIRGRGSMRDKDKEEQNRGKPNWEHLSEDIHVLITVEDTTQRAHTKMEKAVSEIKKLLRPKVEGDDELKKIQLMELAILNGTYRNDSKNYGRSNSHETSSSLLFSPMRAPSMGPMYLGTGPASYASVSDPLTTPQVVQQPVFLSYLPPNGFISDMGNVFYVDPSFVGSPLYEESYGFNEKSN